ncbi:unnamed protein product [Ceratitis capitata]|uniref:(Mediterranean fruit fly) hypothetical protein n=1 Tax=Ceratitis capitata TaxID=7213 RepID=A0A811UU51_CERCA|nr:unnamed protein product [Ceratitis capitata]
MPSNKEEEILSLEMMKELHINNTKRLAALETTRIAALITNFLLTVTSIIFVAALIIKLIMKINFKAEPKLSSYNTTIRQYQPNFQPPRPNEPKPQPKPIPMEIDHSRRTRAINYINRSSYNGIAGKRPPPPSNQLRNNYPNKFQRINHIAQDTNENNKYYEEDTTQDEKMQPWEEYNNEYMRKEQDNPENNFNDFVDVHF